MISEQLHGTNYGGEIAIDGWNYNSEKENVKRLKEDIYKAQRMYYLSQKLGNRISPSMKAFAMSILDQYSKEAKNIDLHLTLEELYNRILKE